MRSEIGLGKFTYFGLIFGRGFKKLAAQLFGQPRSLLFPAPVNEVDFRGVSPAGAGVLCLKTRLKFD